MDDDENEDGTWPSGPLQDRLIKYPLKPQSVGYG